MFNNVDEKQKRAVSHLQAKDQRNCQNLLHITHKKERQREREREMYVRYIHKDISNGNSHRVLLGSNILGFSRDCRIGFFHIWFGILT